MSEGGDNIPMEFDYRWDSDSEGDIVASYANNFPAEIKRAVSGMDGELQFAIAYLLIEHGRLSFSQLKDLLDVHQQTLTNALRDMQGGSILTRVESGDNEEAYDVYYEITTFGDSFLISLVDSLGTGDGSIDFETGFVEDPYIEGAIFSAYSSVERSGSSGQRFHITAEKAVYQ